MTTFRATGLLFISLLALLSAATAQDKDNLKLAFSTYIGGSKFEQIRDITSDKQGNIYITGGTQSPDFPTTPGVYQRTYRTGGTSTGSSGPMSVFVSKFSKDGTLLWSTFLGGPNYDRAYGIEVDDSGYVYLAGRAGEGFPTTPGVLQPDFAGDSSPNGAYGKQDGFIAKLSPDGSRLIWSTYFGSGDGAFIRDLDIDENGYVYVVEPGSRGAHPHVTPGAFQTAHAGGEDIVVAKIAPDGGSVVWATYYGGSTNDGGGPSIRVHRDGSVTVAGSTNSTNLVTSPGAHQRSYAGGTNDLFIVKFTANGELVYSTYLGGSGNEAVETHNLAVDADGNAYVSSGTTSANFPTTPGVFQAVRQGGSSDSYIAKVSADGRTLLASTFIGGSADEFTHGIYVDADRNVFIGGYTSSDNFPVTSSAYQSKRMGGAEVFVLKLAADFSRPLYASYLGGSGADDGRTMWADEAGNIYSAGQTESTNFPVLNAFQSAYIGPGTDDDGYVTRFAPELQTSVPTPIDNTWCISLDVFPIPLSGDNSLRVHLLRAGRTIVTLHDVFGRQLSTIVETELASGLHTFPFAPAGLPAGIYLIRLQSEAGTVTRLLPLMR